jgi:hypothetical protein
MAVLHIYSCDYCTLLCLGYCTKSGPIGTERGHVWLGADVAWRALIKPRKSEITLYRISVLQNVCRAVYICYELRLSAYYIRVTSSSTLKIEVAYSSETCVCPTSDIMFFMLKWPNKLIFVFKFVFEGGPSDISLCLQYRHYKKTVRQL